MWNINFSIKIQNPEFKLFNGVFVYFNHIYFSSIVLLFSYFGNSENLGSECKLENQAK